MLLCPFYVLKIVAPHTAGLGIGGIRWELTLRHLQGLMLIVPSFSLFFPIFFAFF